jgi:hypothetical protein
MAQRRAPARGAGTEDINRVFMDDIAYRRDPDAFKP